MTKRSWTAFPLCILALTACGTGDGVPTLVGRGGTGGGEGPPVITCTIQVTAVSLPEEIHETSGLAQSRRDANLFWTHNDAGNEAELFAIDSDGLLVQRVRISGAEALDWEDIESGPCDSGDCLFLGDIGDNGTNRDRITVYRLAEPSQGATEATPVEALHARYPDGPRNAESIFRLPSGDLYVVTKGSGGPVELYRFPTPHAAGQVATLERVRELFAEPADNQDQVTAATASSEGRWVAVRSYANLYLYRADDLLGSGDAQPAVVDLALLEQRQGESVAISDRGAVWMTSEATGEGTRPELGALQCTFPDA